MKGVSQIAVAIILVVLAIITSILGADIILKYHELKVQESKLKPCIDVIFWGYDGDKGRWVFMIVNQNPYPITLKEATLVCEDGEKHVQQLMLRIDKVPDCKPIYYDLPLTIEPRVLILKLDTPHDEKEVVLELS